MIKYLVFIVCALVLVIVLKNAKSPIANIIVLPISVCVLLLCLSSLEPTLEFTYLLANESGFNNEYLSIILKCIGICFLCSITTRLCTDAGETALSHSAEIICKINIISLTLPIYIDLFKWIMKIWEKL